VIGAHTVGRWGIVAKAVLPKGETGGPELNKRWKAWVDSTQCDADGRLNFYGLQRLIVRTIVQDGEVLIRRRRRRPSDGLAIPLQLQVLEPDFLDTGKDAVLPNGAGRIVQGVEFDLLGRRVAYWLFEEHPGSGRISLRGGSSGLSKRVPAEDVLHVFRVDRPGQVRGVSWFAPAIVKLKDFDEYGDATLMRQKIAACFSAFVTDTEGLGSPLGKADDTEDPGVDTLEPGLIVNLPPGKEVTFAMPPGVGEHASFSAATLRGIAAALDVTYEDITGDYSNVNFSSARMGRLTHQDSVEEWRWDMLVPQFLDLAWRWAMEQLVIIEVIRELVGAEWTATAMPMIDPDKEVSATKRAVRTGMRTFSEMIREQGKDPEAHLAEYAADLQKLDALRIRLDSDVRAVSDAGLTQERTGAGAAGGGKPAAADEEQAAAA
jgi:lambda family phage portal protein